MSAIILLVADHLIHGLTVRFPRPVAGAAGAGQEVELDYVLADLDGELPEGEPASALQTAGGGYVATSAGDALWIRFHGTAEFTVEPGRRRIGVRSLPGARAGMVDVLLTGNVLALALGLVGAAVLHASTVAIDGTLVAFAGGSGAGKSTAVALMCRTGAALFGDDTLRVESDGVTAHRGIAEVRLRAGSVSLARTLSGPARVTADERQAIVLPMAPLAIGRLASVVLPRWRRGVEGVTVARVPARRALTMLLSVPRVAGWSLQGPIRANFSASAAMAREVPVFTAELPFGMPFDDDLPDRLRDALAAAGALPR